MPKLSFSLVIKLTAALFLLVSFNCKKESATISEESKEIEALYAGVPNPAAVYCEELGYKSETRTDSMGGQHGVCVFPDKSECRSWDFLKGKCGQKFTFCERQGYKIENRVKDMGTWRAEYAVCVFPDGSERPEWKFFEEKRKRESEE